MHSFHSIRFGMGTNRHLLLLLIFFVLVGYTIILIKFNCQWFRPRAITILDGLNGDGRIDAMAPNKHKVGKMFRDLIDCDRIFRGDWDYAVANKFFMDTDPDQKELPMDCASIRTRNGLLQSGTTEEEANFPLAFARIVFKDYLMLEMELATNYAPQNWYCYALDTKSSPLFQLRMRQLAKCFPNVLIARRRFSISSAGHNTSNAMVECARELARPGRKWRYLVTLQNHDIQAKTNAEMVKIFEWLDGANDVEMGKIQEWRLAFYQENFNWSFSALKLFKNEERNSEEILHLSKGYSSASLSRPFIDFLMDELNLDKLLEQLNKADFGVDEHLWQILTTTDALNAPGSFPQHCYDQGHATPFITRFALWDGQVDFGRNLLCSSGQWRHSVCVFGVEDLLNTALLETPSLFINKMMPEYDFGAIKCWHEKMVERRLNQSEKQLNPKYYQNWPQTRYNKLRREKKRPPIETNEIDCT